MRTVELAAALGSSGEAVAVVYASPASAWRRGLWLPQAAIRHPRRLFALPDGTQNYGFGTCSPGPVAAGSPRI